MNSRVCSRRRFLRTTSILTVGAPFALSTGANIVSGAEPAAKSFADAKVAIASCKNYGSQEIQAAYGQCFDLLGGVGSLVKGKTVTIKINLTGTDFTPFLNRPVGETYMTHEATAQALAAALFKAGAKRIVFVESTQSRASLEGTLELSGWDVKALSALGDVQYENTRNLGSGNSYSHIKVPSGGLMFSSFDVNYRYVDTDVMVSLCKLKNHITAGVTLSMKNMFGITPNSLYGDKAGDEEATAGRGPLHNRNDRIKLPGIKEAITSNDATWRVPRIIVDEIAARPLHLCVIDGITSMSGGEGSLVPERKPVDFHFSLSKRVRVCLNCMVTANPEPCSRNRGARPSRSLCSASRRTGGAAESTHRMGRQGDCCQHVGGTPTAAVETTALPICNCIVG